MGGLDLRDVEAVDVGGGDVGPRLAVVGGDVNEPVVGPGPQEAGGQRRFGEGHHGPVRLGLRSHGEDPLQVAVGEVVADALPPIAPVRELEDAVAAEVEGGRLVWGDEEGRVPVEAESRLAFLGRGPQHPPLAGVEVDAADVASLRFGVDDVRIEGAEGDVEPVAAPDELPVVVGDGAVAAHVAVAGFGDRLTGTDRCRRRRWPWPESRHGALWRCLPERFGRRRLRCRAPTPGDRSAGRPADRSGCGRNRRIGG